MLLDGLNDNQVKFLESHVAEKKIDDKRWHVCRHTPANIKRLRRVGIPTPTLDVGYKFYHPDKGFEYYKHQKTTAGFLSMHHRAWCLNGLRSGKTFSAITGREMLREIGFKGRTLILCPENVMNEAWGDNYKLTYPRLNVYVADKTVKHLQDHGMQPEVDVLILGFGKLPYCVLDLHEWDFDHLIVDEGSVFRTPGKEPVINLNYLARKRDIDELDYLAKPGKRWLWNLTGTPRPMAPTNIHAMARLINPQAMPYSFDTWKNMTMKHFDVFEKKPNGQRGKFIFRRWDDREDELVERLCAEAMKPSIRFRTEDCVDMPAQAYNYFHCEMKGTQKKLYGMIARHKAAEHEGDAFKVSLTPNKFSKLMQCAGGTMKNTDGEWVEIGCKARLDTLVDLYHQADGKTVVFVEFKHTATWLKAQLAKKGIKSDIINGSVSQKRRDTIRKKFQSTRNKSVLIMNAGVTKFGTNVSKASVTAWWTPPASGEIWEQANERARAPGSGKTLVAMFYGSASEREYYERARNRKRRNAGAVDFNAEFRKTKSYDSDLEDQFLRDWSISD